jgi:hypothetical protein
MRQNFLSTAILFLGTVIFLIVPAVVHCAELQAGAARMEITPPVGFAMWGYGARHDAPSTGVLDPLQARAVVLKVGDQAIAIVSLDLGRAPTRESFVAILKAVKARTGIEHLFLVGSHTHHGPVLETRNWPSKEKPYARQLEEKIIQVIVTADKNRQPARFGIASRQVNWNRNRHSRLPNPPVDHELIVVRLVDLQGKPIAHLVNFAAHPTMLPSNDRRLSADYPGVLAATVEKETGAPCLFLQGAAGDLSPNAGSERGPQKFGAVLAREVLQLAGTIVATAGKNTALKVQERQFQFKMRFDLSNQLLNNAFRLAFFPELVEFYEREYRDGVRPRSTTAVLDERIGLVGVSGEFFTSHSLNLKKRARLDYLLFFGYCNDYHQYFPTIEAAAEGGYGADPQVAPAEVGAGEQIMNRALVDLYSLRGRVFDWHPPK